MATATNRCSSDTATPGVGDSTKRPMCWPRARTGSSTPCVGQLEPAARRRAAARTGGPARPSIAPLRPMRGRTRRSWAGSASKRRLVQRRAARAARPGRRRSRRPAGVPLTAASATRWIRRTSERAVPGATVGRAAPRGDRADHHRRRRAAAAPSRRRRASRSPATGRAWCGRSRTRRRPPAR